MRGPVFVLIANFTSKVQLITCLNKRSKTPSLLLKSNITANVAKGIRMISTLSRHFKMTTKNK